MSDFLKRTWLQINLDALDKNFETIKNSVTPGTKILSVVKADAYGHGVERLVAELDRIGTDWFAVSNLEEALQVRKFSAEKPILILGYTPPECASKLALNNISQAVFNLDYGKKLSYFAQKENVVVNIHIKIDTGMSRIGFLYNDNIENALSVDEIIALCAQPNLYKEGIFTHFASADEDDSGVVYTRLQYDLFCNMIDILKQNDIHFDIRHCCNSAATVLYPEMHMDLVRPGIILYGLLPSDFLKDKIELHPVMEMKTVVSMVKEIAKDTPVSYGRTYTSEQNKLIATVPLGYADGYPRKLSNKASMLIGGKRVPVMGRVCMDQIMLDVTDIPPLSEGQVVTVFGEDNGACISIDEIAKLNDTVNYEIVCSISKRVPRVYLHNNKVESTTSYMDL